MVVSIISIGAGSVAVSARPSFPATEATSCVGLGEEEVQCPKRPETAYGRQCFQGYLAMRLFLSGDFKENRYAQMILGAAKSANDAVTYRVRVRRVLCLAPEGR